MFPLALQYCKHMHNSCHSHAYMQTTSIYRKPMTNSVEWAMREAHPRHRSKQASKASKASKQAKQSKAKQSNAQQASKKQASKHACKQANDRRKGPSRSRSTGLIAIQITGHTITPFRPSRSNQTKYGRTLLAFTEGPSAIASRHPL